jgi:hypothetical protein
MSAAKMIVAALLLPALVLAGVAAAVVWICRQRRNTSTWSPPTSAATCSARRIRLTGMLGAHG